MVRNAVVKLTRHAKQDKCMYFFLVTILPTQWVKDVPLSLFFIQDFCPLLRDTVLYVGGYWVLATKFVFVFSQLRKHLQRRSWYCLIFLVSLVPKYPVLLIGTYMFVT